ncbi:hypothetical protein [Paraliomyxa miuraensis]|uniref:hypothetical protein n=1 Tax=Paraliomyxa miuraensis TaxID=376150 RepID=UPI0022570D0D|nr:hypothetical protein [Paraliomyxa miuraensis]MCX4241225.1 hypothetical protein [Paraliomyxa miuraensis]
MRRLASLALGPIAVAAALLGLSAPASAHPGVEGTRNLSLGSVARSSSFGTNAALINPSNMPFVQTFAIEPIYQAGLAGKRHGLGFVIMDSLNNPRLSVGLGYLVMRGSPTVSFTSDDPVRVPADGETSLERQLELVHVAHETFGAIGVTVVKNWLAVGAKPKYQFSSLRYKDAMGVAHDAHDRLSTFGLDFSATLNFQGWAAISAVTTNVVGNHPPAFHERRELDLADAGAAAGSVDSGNVSELSDFPLTFEHGLSVFPLHNPNFSLNFDGLYDFSSFYHQRHTRMAYGGSAEFVLGPVPIRFGTLWDGRGQSKDDDRIYVAGGLAYVKPAKEGGVGVDIGAGVRQQVTGPGLGGQLETVLSFNLGLRLRPDL